MPHDQPRSESNTSGFCFDTLYALIKHGPVWDGDVPSKSGRNQLIEHGYAVSTLRNGEEGHTAVTYKGIELFKSYLGVETIKEGFAKIDAKHAVDRAARENKARIRATRLIEDAEKRLEAGAKENKIEVFSALVSLLSDASSGNYTREHIELNYATLVAMRKNFDGPNLVEVLGSSPRANHAIVTTMADENTPEYTVLLYMRAGERQRNAAVTFVLPIYLDFNWNLKDIPVIIPDEVKKITSRLIRDPYGLGDVSIDDTPPDDHGSAE